MAQQFSSKAAVAAIAGSSAILVAGATSAHGNTIEVRADASREILLIDPGSPEAAAGFQVGEAVTMEFTFDTTVPDASTNPTLRRYDDPNATYRLIGGTSGATLAYAAGLRIEIREDFSFRLGSIVNPATAVDSPVLSRQIKVEERSVAPLFSDTGDLDLVFAQLFSTTFADPRPFDSETTYWDGSGPVLGMRMDGVPVNARFTLIPSPGVASMLGVAGLAATRRRR